MNNTNVTVSGFDNGKIGTNTIIVTYGGKSSTFNINIISKQVTKIEIASRPTKSNYIQNKETLDLSGGEVKVTYNDGSTDTIPLTNKNVKVSGFDNSKIGTNIIAITYGEKTTNFNIEIISKQITYSLF